MELALTNTVRRYSDLPYSLVHSGLCSGFCQVILLGNTTANGKVVVPQKGKNMTTQAWKDHAYPLQGIKIELQGTRHSNQADLLSQLKEVVARIESGDTDGESSDDDFGYKFIVTSATNTSIFGDEPFTQK